MKYNISSTFFIYSLIFCFAVVYKSGPLTYFYAILLQTRGNKKTKNSKNATWSYREHCWGNRPQSYTDHRDLPSVPSLNSNLRPPTLQAWLRCALSTMKITIRVHDLDISFYMIKAKANEHSGLLRGRSRQRKPLYATGLSICLSVCVLPSCVQKRDFLKKNNQSRATVSIHDL